MKVVLQPLEIFSTLMMNGSFDYTHVLSWFLYSMINSFHKKLMIQ